MLSTNLVRSTLVSSDTSATDVSLSVGRGWLEGVVWRRSYLHPQDLTQQQVVLAHLLLEVFHSTAWEDFKLVVLVCTSIFHLLS